MKKSRVLLSLVLVGLSGWLLWTASRTETGFETLTAQWRRATVGFVVPEEIPVQRRHPAGQADIWLLEADRVVAAHPHDAQVAMGAALVLDAPAVHWLVYEFMPQSDSPWTDDQDKNLQSAMHGFESRCAKRALELAERATTIDPRNLDAWRARSILLLHHSVAKFDGHWRDAKCLEVLADCERHDPDNALYDYLAALWCWESSASIEDRDFEQFLVIADRQRFERGIASFEEGQSKPIFAFGNDGACVLAFLRRTSMPLADRPKTANLRFFNQSQSNFLSRLHDWQELRATEYAREDDPWSALAIHKQSIRLLDQLSTRSWFWGGSNRNDLRIDSIQSMREVVDECGIVMTPKDVTQVDQRDYEIRLRKLTMEKVAKSMGRPGFAVDSRLVFSNGSLPRILGFLFHMIPAVFIATAVAGAVAYGLSKLCGDAACVNVHVAWRFAAMIVALLSTFVLLGLAPARVIPEDLQAWGLTLIILSPVGLIVAVVLSGLRRGKVVFSLRTVMIGIILLCLLLGMLPLFLPTEGSFSGLPFHLPVPMFVHLESDLQDWFEPVRQWREHRGPGLTIVAWIGLMSALFIRQADRRPLDNGAEPLRNRDLAASWLRLSGRSLLGLAAVLLAAYLATAPAAIGIIEEDCQQSLAYALRPHEYFEEVDAEVWRIQADTSLMEELRSAAEAEVRSAKTSTPFD